MITDASCLQIVFATVSGLRSDDIQQVTQWQLLTSLQHACSSKDKGCDIEQGAYNGTGYMVT